MRSAIQKNSPMSLEREHTLWMNVGLYSLQSAAILAYYKFKFLYF